LLNLIDSFKINKKQVDNIDNKTVIIIDDVISTGSTINEVSKILKEN
jgi:predicted amidophosphoribosyltransferase